MARVELDGVSKVYCGRRGEKVAALQNFSLTVADRELVVMVGPSGCGKTTALRLIAGLEEVSGGTISVDGKIVNDQEPKDRDMAMVFQNYALYPHMTVYQNLAFGLELRKMAKMLIRERVAEASEMLGLKVLWARYPKALSGGERQRVALGRAIVRKPKVFLFDEPLSNLDAQRRAQMRLEIAQLHRRLGATMIYVTHDQMEAMTLGDRIVVMKDGLAQQIAAPLTVYNHPASQFVAGFIGSPPMNFFPGIIRGGPDALWFESAGRPGASQLRFPLSPQTATVIGRRNHPGVVFGLRPEQFQICPPHSPPPAIQATIQVIEPMGAETWLHLDTGAQTIVARLGPNLPVRAQESIWLAADSELGEWFDPSTGLNLKQGGPVKAAVSSEDPQA